MLTFAAFSFNRMGRRRPLRRRQGGCITAIAAATNQTWIWVDDPGTAAQANTVLGAARLLAVDTEYDSFRYFRDKLCLIQVRAEGTTFLFDPLAACDLSFLGTCFADPAVLKVFHAGDNDIRILQRDYGMTFANIFDTHRAAGLLGCHYLSLSTLITQYLGIEFVKSKKIQRSRWDVRPLTEEQLTYAALDTAWLADLYTILSREIDNRGLQERAALAFRDIAAAQWRERTVDRRGHEKLVGYESLSAEEKGRAKKLFAWRYLKAREIDRAMFMILSDAEIIHLARLNTPRIEGPTEGGPPREVGKAFREEIQEVLRKTSR
jgi:ribonuclease D